MKVCFPVFQNHGLSSLVSSHFDSAPLCVIVDTVTGSMVEVANRSSQESHGLCQALAKLGEIHDAIFVVDGIGAGALTLLTRAGFKVYQAAPGTVADNLKRIARNELDELLLTPVVPDTAFSEDDDESPQFGCGF